MQDDLLQRFLVSRSRTDLEALVRGEHAWLLAIAQHVAHDPGLAEDAVQEVFMKLIESPPAANVVQTSRGWLAACVIGAARTLLRGKSRREHRERVASRPEVLGDDRRDLDHDEVRAAVFELADPQRECVELRYFAGLSADEIGRTLGCARRTVDERLASARESLRKRLAPHAFALIAAGIQHETIVPRVTASREFIGRLERLLEHPSLITRTTAAGASAMFTWLAAAIVVSIGALAVWSGSQRGTDSSATIAAQSPAPRRDESQSSSSEGASEPIDTRVATPSSADVQIVKRIVRSSADLRVHVIDESGAHVKAGELRLEPDGFSASAALLSLAQREDLARFAELLDPIPLAGRNPFEVRQLPNELVGQSFRAYAVVPGFGTPEPAKFVLDADKMCELTLTLRAPRTVTITVEDRATHHPLADATVLSTTEFERRDIDAAAALREHAPGAGTTDALGRCTLDRLGAGVHEIEVHAAGHASSGLKLAADEDHLTASLDVASKFATVLVDVTDPGNMPVAGAPVICHRYDRALDERGSTDAMGRCRFDKIEPGSWTVSLDVPSFGKLIAQNKWKGENQSFGTSIDLDPGEFEVVHLGFLAGTASWAIEVVDARGRPCGDIEVSISGPVQRSAKTRKDGRVLFEHLPDGQWSYAIDGWSSRDHEIRWDSMRSDRVEIGRARIRGRVKFADSGAPAAGASVIASGDVYAMHACDENGQFQFENVPSGTFVVGAGAVGYQSPEATVKVENGDPPPIELVLVRRTADESVK
jgi:RNA polymerase sigma-70 factor (ECF subfamily)